MKKIQATAALLLLTFISIKTFATDPKMVSSATTSQFRDDQISKKEIVVKVRSQYQGLCSANEISEPKVMAIFSKYNVIGVRKFFPLAKSPSQALNKSGKKPVDLTMIYKVKINAGTDILQLVAALTNTGVMEYAEPIYLQKMDYTPNDPQLAAQYQIAKINALAAWDVWKGDTNTVIGIVDSGTDWDHPDCAANIKNNYADPIDGIDNDNDGFIDNFHGWDMSENDNDPMNVSSDHGSHVAGCASAVTDNGVGVGAPGFKCKILPVKASLDASTTAIDDGYDGIVYAADHGAHVINCSWGRTGGASQFEQDIINYAVLDKDVTMVAAAGNGGIEEDHYPSSYDNCVSVASTGANDGRSSFSSYSFKVDVCAPGTNILSTVYNDSYTTMSGTSMASPIAAGCAAMIKSKFPTLNALQVGEQLRVTCDNIYGTAGNISFTGKLGKGRVNLFKAVTDSISPGVTLKTWDIKDGNDQVFIIGDTLNIVNLLQNLLRPTTNLVCSLTTTSGAFLQILNSTWTVGVLNTMDTISNYNAPFRVLIKPGTPLNTEVLLRLTLTDGAWSDMFSIKLTVNQDYINIAINDVATSITSKGLIGYNLSGQAQGLGFTYQGGSTILYEMSLMCGAQGTQVSDNFRGATAGATDEDMSPVNTVVRVDPPVVSDFDAEGSFNDAGITSSAPLNLLITHHAYAWTLAPDNKYIMVQYYIKNVGSTTLNGFAAGIVADWDIPAFGNNKASTDAARRMGYVWSTDSAGIWAGIKLLSNTGTFNHYAIDNYAANGGLDLSNGFSDPEKYTSMTTSRLDAGIAQASTGNDVISSVSANGYTLAPNDEIEVTFALIAGENLQMIQAAADYAQVKYNTTLGILQPIDLAKGTGIKGVYPNPADKQSRIEFELATSGKTTIAIYNSIGVKVKEVLAETLSTGAYSLLVDVSDLSAGSYICRMTTPTNSTATQLNVVH
jgi:hypothetical protein